MPGVRELALLVTASAGAFGADRLGALIISGRNNHDWRETTPFLRQALDATGRFDVRVTEEAAGLNASALGACQVLVLNYNGKRWGATAENAVEQFVRSGKGMVVVHGASYAFGEMEVLGDNHKRTGVFEPPWPEYARMTGVKWSEGPPRSGHGKRHIFEVKWADRAHPVAAGLPETFLASDELYHHLIFEPGVHVLATAFDDPRINGTGKDEPVLWTVNYGKGRVFHTTLGHDAAAMLGEGFMASFARGAEWAASGIVTPAAVSTGPGGGVRALVVTGGHDHEASFYSLFEGYKDLRATVSPHPIAFRGDPGQRYDVLVLYDMAQEIGEAQKKNLRAFVESGKGLVVLHHALADYNGWAWWHREVVGGRYLLEPDGERPKSAFKHDEWIRATPVGEHPVLKGVSPMLLFDETYKHMEISPQAKVLLKTDNPTSDGPLAWISPYAKSRVVVIQLGHGREAHMHPGYRQLVRNAVMWAAGRLR
ncbi:MAG: ThuA domain-containing protein [Acidobacteria bacterium]|nr:ThuA domain-containing protein [Acidobacteriota bacterium]